MKFMDLDAGSVMQANERCFRVFPTRQRPKSVGRLLERSAAWCLFALEFENKDYFSVKVENIVWSSRAVPWAGITTVHWPSDSSSNSVCTRRSSCASGRFRADFTQISLLATYSPDFCTFRQQTVNTALMMLSRCGKCFSNVFVSFF